MLLRRSPVLLFCRAVAIVLISGLLGATIIRVAPGFGIDEQMLDPRLSPQSLEVLHRGNPEQRNLLVFYRRFLGDLLHGDAGRSVVYGQPVRGLIVERAPTTIRSVFAGLTVGWSMAIVFATACLLSGRTGTVLFSMAISGLFLSIPSAVLATLCLILDLPPAAAIAAVVYPRVFPHVYEQFRASQIKPHVMMARARGLSSSRVFFFHLAPPAVMPVLAVAGVSVTLAFGASIPIEALADSPGLGQLAWRAALGRDLPVLVTITLLLTAVTVFANLMVDIVTTQIERPAA
jgi:peptide/nickel transport system permease protein